MDVLRRASIIFFFLLILASSLVLAQPPFQSNANLLDNELEIVYPKTEYFKLGQDFDLHFHVVDSNSTPVLNTDFFCIVHVYDNENNHVLMGQTTNSLGNNLDDEIELNSSVITELGSYSYNIFCNASSVNQYGFVSTNFIMTNSGVFDETDAGTKWLSILLALLGMTGIMLFITTQIKDKLLKPVKIVFFAISVVNGLFLGVLSYIISLNPYDSSSYKFVGLAYASINVLLIMGFVFNYAFVLFARIYKRSKDRWVNSFKGEVRK